LRLLARRRAVAGLGFGLGLAALLAGCTGGDADGGAAASSAASAASSSAPGVAGDRWTEKAAAPVERTEVGAAALGGRVWVVGGLAPTGEASADVVVYDPASDAWTTGPALPQALHHTAVAGDGTRLWVAGGYTHDRLREPTAAVRVLDPATGQWQDGPPLPSPRGAGALAWDGRRLVYGGGVGPEGLAGDVFALEGGAWRRLGELHPPREHLAAASDGRGTTWFLAGRTGGIDKNLADVDVVAGAEVVHAGLLPTPRGGVAGFHVQGAGGCAAGGEGPDGTFVEVECLTSDGQASTLPPLARSRHGLGAVTVAGAAYTLLGGPSPGLTTSRTVESLDLAPPP
jgi:hypothetical protein